MNDKINTKEIVDFIELWEKMSNAYFWSPPTSAASRRNYEKSNSLELNIIINNKTYQGTINVACSCRNIYVSRRLFVDGEKKRITALKKVIGYKLAKIITK